MTDTASHEISKRPALWQKLTLWFENASPFQRSFVEGLGAAIVVLLLLFLWMFFRTERTAEKIQSQFPAEAVEILRPGSSTHTAIPDNATEELLRHGQQQIEHDADTSETVAVAEQDGTIAEAKSSAALPVAPIEGLFERKGNLILPKIHLGADGDVTPFQSYRRPFVPVYGRALIAVVVTDFGLSQNVSDEILDGLPADVTFALSPYAAGSMDWAAKTRADGHELWLSLPMQTKHEGADAGPNAISVNASLQDNQNALWNVLGSTVGYAGVVSQPDHAFSGNDIDVEPILKQIYGRGLAFAESNPGISGFAETMAKTNNAPYVRNDLWVGDNFQGNAVDRALQDAERLAAKNGQAVIFVRPYPASLEKLALWIAEFEDRGLQLAPLSAMVQE